VSKAATDIAATNQQVWRSWASNEIDKLPLAALPKLNPADRRQTTSTLDTLKKSAAASQVSSSDVTIFRLALANVADLLDFFDFYLIGFVLAFFVGLLLVCRAAEEAGIFAWTALAAAHDLAVANDNSPQQIVLSGPRERLPAAAHAARQLGLRAMELPVTGAFHSPMMASAVPELQAALARVQLRPSQATVVSAVTAAPFDDVPSRLAQAVTMPVRWRETMLALRQLGAERFVEVGPGKVLSGLAKRTVTDVELVHA